MIDLIEKNGYTKFAESSDNSFHYERFLNGEHQRIISINGTYGKKGTISFYKWQTACDYPNASVIRLDKDSLTDEQIIKCLIISGALADN